MTRWSQSCQSYSQSCQTGLLDNAISACEVIYSDFLKKWIENNSSWNDSLQIVHMPDGLTVGAQASNKKVRPHAVAIACIIAHSVFRQVDSGAKCLHKFAALVEVARKEVLNSPSKTVWKGNLRFREKEKKNSGPNRKRKPPV